MKVVSDEGHVMDWPVVYVPRSTGTVLSPDNYLHSFPKSHKAVVEMTKSKWGAIIFKNECDTTLERVTLRRTSNAEWFMSNEVLVANHPNNSTVFPPVESLRVQSLTVASGLGLSIIVEEPDETVSEQKATITSLKSPIVETVDDDSVAPAKQFDDAIPLFDYDECKPCAPSPPARMSSRSPTVETVDDDPAVFPIEFDDAIPLFDYDECHPFAPSPPATTTPKSPPATSHPLDSAWTCKPNHASPKPFRRSVRNLSTPTDHRTFQTGSWTSRLSDALKQLELWHQRYGHASPSTLHATQKVVDGMPPLPSKPTIFKCPFCEKAKMTKFHGSGFENKERFIHGSLLR